MGLIIEKISGKPLLIEVKETDLEQSVQDKINATSSPILYTHPRGDAEYVGNGTLATNASRYGVGIVNVMDNNYLIKYIDVRIYGTITTAAEVRVYKSSTIANPEFEEPFSSLTLLQEFVITAGNFNTNTAGYLTLTASSIWNLSVGEYLWVMVRATASTVTAVRWTSQSIAVPYRLPLVYTGANNWTTNWILTNNTSYGGTPFVLRKDMGVSASDLALKENLLAPRIVLPATINTVVGTEKNLYSDAIVLGTDCGKESPKEYSIEYVCEIGKSKNRCFQHTPITADAGNHSLIANVYNSNHELSGTKNTTLNVIEATAPSAVKRICMIGDSLIAANTITTELQTKFTELGSNIPLFYGWGGIGTAKHQGYGGWRYQDYATNTINFYDFTVSGVSNVVWNENYTNNGSTFRIREIVSATHIRFQKMAGANEPDASGTLTRGGGQTGDATITYSAVSNTVSGNPFWNTDHLDIAYYRNNLGMGANKFDIVTMQLGVNECLVPLLSAASITAIINYAKSIITAFIADYASTKFIIELPTIDCSTRPDFLSLNAFSYYKSIYRQNIWALREAMILAFDNSAYNANVVIGSVGLSLDRYYGYNLAMADVASRITTEEEVHTDPIHPTTAGYNQIADCYFAEILKLIQ